MPNQRNSRNFKLSVDLAIYVRIYAYKKRCFLTGNILYVRGSFIPTLALSKSGYGSEPISSLSARFSGLPVVKFSTS